MGARRSFWQRNWTVEVLDSGWTNPKEVSHLNLMICFELGYCRNNEKEGLTGFILGISICYHIIESGPGFNEAPEKEVLTM